MAEKNVLLKQEILKLINSNAPRAGAILIYGDWGVGKTHFWNHEIVLEMEKLHLYISLTGVKTNNEIYEKLMYNYVIKSSSSDKSVSDVGRFLRKGVQGVKDNIPKFLKGVLEDYKNIPRHFSNLINFSYLIPKNCVVCFDDLERSDVDIPTLMGVCIDLLENHNIQVVMISNKEKIKSSKLDDFLLHKEKIVWKEFSYSASTEVVFDRFLDDLFSNNKQTPIDQDKDIVLECFKKSPANLRVLYRCLHDLARIQTSIKNRMSKKYVEFFCSLYFWSKSGNELKSFVDFDVANYYASSISKKDKEDGGDVASEKKDFFETYYSNVWNAATSEELFNFIKTGYLDTSRLEQEIRPIKGSQGANLHSKLREGEWFFASDETNKVNVELIVEILKKQEDRAKIGFGLGIHLQTICQHSKLTIPVEFDSIFEEFLKSRAGKDEREDIGSFHLEKEFLIEFAEKWKKVFDNYESDTIVQKWKNLFVAQLLNGEEINTFNTNIRGNESLARILTDDEVLGAAASISMKYPSVHYSFYFRAHKSIIETYFEQSENKDKYLTILKASLEGWKPLDHSALKRKELLMNRFKS